MRLLRFAFRTFLVLASILFICSLAGVDVVFGIDIGALGPAAGMAIAAAPFPIDPDLQAVSVAYRNERLIGDQVLPRRTVSKEEFKYYAWDKHERFTLPDTKVGRTSRPNQVEFRADEKTSKTEDYGLDDPIPNADVANAPTGINPRANAAESLTDLILLDREVRVAAKVFNAATYPAGNKETLVGNAQFSDAANSAPIEVIGDALDVPIVRPNTMVLGQEAWTKLRRHPDILKAINMSAGDKGMASRQAVAELFELEELLVGASRLNTARKGQAPSLARVWGKHIALLFLDRLADPTLNASRITFGFTAQFGSRVAGAIEDKDIGLRGGVRVRVGESVDEHIVANDVAYFIEDAVA